MSNRPQPASPELEKIETFLLVNALEITEPYRAKIREAAAKAIRGEDINLNHCPAHLRPDLLDIIVTEAEKRRERIEADYLNRSNGQKFNVDKNKNWI